MLGLRRVRLISLEAALTISVLGLIVQLFLPAALRWWLGPSPGQTGIAYLPDNPSRFSGLFAEYLVHLPADRGGQKLPALVVFLHGAGKRGRDVEPLRPQCEAVAAAPQNRSQAIVAVPQCVPEARWQATSLKSFVEHVESRFKTDPDRVYLIGFSMGGYGVWSAAKAHPERYAAAVPIAGGAGADVTPALADLPLWVFHGQDDEVVPVSEATEIVEALKAIGGQPRVTVYEDQGHGILWTVLQNDDLWNWAHMQSTEDSR